MLPWNWSGHDPQKMKIFFHLGMADELDTFHGTYQKDLIPGTAKTEMWFTTREQEIILTKLDEIRFFTWPDTLAMEPGVHESPDFGYQTIRIKTAEHDKTVVWYAPISRRLKLEYYLQDLQGLFNDIIHSKPEYKALPARKGGYM
jgi:hypothetical protein